jgi:hypothetical protein
MIDYRLEHSTDASQRAAIIHEIGPSLKTRWVRLLVDWAALEFERGTYSPTEVAQLDSLVDGLHAAGVKVILTTHRRATPTDLSRSTPSAPQPWTTTPISASS